MKITNYSIIYTKIKIADIKNLDQCKDMTLDIFNYFLDIISQLSVGEIKFYNHCLILFPKYFQKVVESLEKVQNMKIKTYCEMNNIEFDSNLWYNVKVSREEMSNKYYNDKIRQINQFNPILYQVKQEISMFVKEDGNLTANNSLSISQYTKRIENNKKSVVEQQEQQKVNKVNKKQQLEELLKDRFQMTTILEITKVQIMFQKLYQQKLTLDELKQLKHVSFINQQEIQIDWISVLIDGF